MLFDGDGQAIHSVVLSPLPNRRWLFVEETKAEYWTINTRRIFNRLDVVLRRSVVLQPSGMLHGGVLSFLAFCRVWSVALAEKEGSASTFAVVDWLLYKLGFSRL